MKRSLVCVALALLAALLPLSSSPSAEAQSTRSIQILHLVPPGVTPLHDDLDVRIPATMSAIQRFLQQDVGRFLRITPGVTQVEAQGGTDESIQDQLIAQGYSDLDTIYLVFAEMIGSGGANTCGRTFQRYQNEPAYSFVFMPACGGLLYPAPAEFASWPYDATFVTLHELLHAMGAVAPCAPNHHPQSRFHVNDSPLDILFHGQRTPEQFLSVTIDVNRNDYYDHGNRSCADLIASPYWLTPPPRFCEGQLVTLDMGWGQSGTGTADDDVIRGTPGSDIIDGGGGNDIICGRGGNDVIDGGSGNDIINGESGDDTIVGGLGFDDLDGQDGADRIWGGDAADQIEGGPGDDVLNGGAGWDRISGESGDDVITGGPGNDWVWAGPGNDDLDGGPGDDLLLGFDGNDTITAGGGRDRMNGMNGSDTIDGGDGSDQIWGGFGDDTINAGSGFDWVWGSYGDDTINGGHGNDSLFGESNHDTINGGPGNDLIDGSFGNDLLNGNNGNDVINGGDLNDIINGDSGNDVLHGNNGNDTLNGGPGGDTCTGGAGNNTQVNCEQSGP